MKSYPTREEAYPKIAAAIAVKDFAAAAQEIRTRLNHAMHKSQSALALVAALLQDEEALFTQAGKKEVQARLLLNEVEGLRDNSVYNSAEFRSDMRIFASTAAKLFLDLSKG